MLVYMIDNIIEGRMMLSQYNNSSDFKSSLFSIQDVPYL